MRILAKNWWFRLSGLRRPGPNVSVFGFRNGSKRTQIKTSRIIRKKKPNVGQSQKHKDDIINRHKRNPNLIR